MLRKVRDLRITGRDYTRILYQMSDMGGFGGRHLGEAFQILRSMLDDADCLRLLSFPAAMVGTGIRGVLVEFVKRKFFDVIITTCGTIDHDLARCYGHYYAGSFYADDVELLRRGYHRLGNVYIPKEAYGPLIEEKVRLFLEKEGLEELANKPFHEILWRMGERLCDESSILWWAAKNRVPIIVPAPLDGAVGHQFWLAHQKDKSFRVDLMQDQDLLAEMIFGAKRLGGLIIGGGVSKHHLIWWSQYRGGLTYAVYITTAAEYDGSLSGALTKEAISWGKIAKSAKHVTVHSDATIVLPFLAHALLEVRGRKATVR